MSKLAQLLALLFALTLPGAALTPAANAGVATLSVGVASDSEGSSDTTPDAFSFTDQTDVALSSTITSTAVTITGIDESITCSATGGTIDKNSVGSFSSSQSIANNDTIRARHTSSSSNSTATNTAVDCNGVSDTFTSTTEAGGGDTGISEYEIETLITGLDGLTENDDNSELTVSWETGEGGFARLTWADDGTSGLRYAIQAETKQVYISYEIRRHSAYFSKQIKVLDRSVGGGTNYSNMTFGPSHGAGLEQQSRGFGINYGDGVSGTNDNAIANDIEGFDAGDPFTRAPPRNRVTSSDAAYQQDVSGTVWRLVEIFVKFNDPDTQNGEVAIWFDGELVLWEDQMYNSTNANGYPSTIGIGEVSYHDGLVEDYRRFRVSVERPVGRGID